MEQKNKKKGMRISIIVHILILLLAFFLILPNDPNQDIDTQFAVAVNFANTTSSASNTASSTAGKARPKTEEIVKIETTPAKKVEPTKTETSAPEITPEKVPQPEPTEPIVTETVQDESEVIAVEEEIPVEEPEPEVIQEEAPEIITISEPEVIRDNVPSLEDVLADLESEPEEPSSGTIDDIEISSPDESGPAPSEMEGDETGTGESNTGSGSGADDSGDDGDSGIGDGGAGLGEYDASGDGIFGRRVIYRDRSMITQASSKSGKIVFKVCINRKGSVEYVELNEIETTISDRNLLRKAIKAMWKYRYAADPTAPREQCGKFTVTIDNFQGIRGIN